MERSEWELARQIDRKLRFITQQCGKIETHDREIKDLQLELESMSEVFEEFKAILRIKKKIRNAFFWVIMVACTAGLTKFVDYHISQAMITRDEVKMPTRVVDESGPNK